MPTAQEAIHALFHPRAVAVIGASDDGTKHGYIVLNNVRDTGFSGGVYGISRRLRQVHDIPCHPDLASVPEPVDVAFLAIPAEAAVQAVRDCARAGLKVVIVGSAGYAESLDAGGAERQRELQRAADAAGIRIVGPNCNGIYNAHHSVSIGFNTAHAKRQKPGGVSIFSHSGALFDAMAGRLAMAGEGLSLFASAGNEADLSVLDYMEYAITHEPTKVIALLIDSLPDGARFRALAIRAHQAGKPVVALKIGGSAVGAAAAVAHSSRLAGDAAAYRALFDASGVAVVSTLEGMMTASALLARHGRRPGMLGAMSTSGAGASLIADRCDAFGIPLAPLTDATRAALDAHKMFSRAGNPLDLGIFGGMRRSGEVPELLMGDPDVSVVLALLHSMNPWQGDPYRTAMETARERTGRPVLIVSPGGLPEAERATYETMGMDVFTEMDIVLEGVGAMLTPPPPPIPAMDMHIQPARRRWVLEGDAWVLAEATDAIPELPATPLTELESLELLERFGVRMPATILCAGYADGFPPSLQAAGEAGSFKFPVVVKKVVRGVAHKTELGFVRTGLMSEAEVERAVEDMGNGPVLLQSTIEGDLETIAGVTRADGVGLVVLAGLGGIHAEAIRDVSMWPVPTARETIERTLQASTLGRIVTSPRWKHPAALPAFVDVLMALQAAAMSFGDRLQAIDINPVILGVDGATAVDALIVPVS